MSEDSYKTKDGKILKFSEINMNYIDHNGIYHFTNLTEGNSDGDFGRYLKFKEVEIFNPEVLGREVTFNDLIERINIESSKSDICDGEFYFSEVEERSDTPNEHCIYNSYDISYNIDINDNVITLYCTSDSGSTFSLSVPSKKYFKGFIRFNSSLISSEKYKTFIFRDGSVFSQEIEELYNYEIIEDNRENN